MILSVVAVHTFWFVQLVIRDMPCHGTSSSDESQQQTENVTKHATHNALGLTIIFSFTQRDHLFVLVPAIAFSCLCGLIKPTLSILIGRYLTSLSKLASPSADVPAVTQQNWTTICQLVGLAAFTWISKTGFAATWDGYAEVQVKVVREDLFKTLLDRDLEWFDKQDSGIGSLLIRLQTYAIYHKVCSFTDFCQTYQGFSAWRLETSWSGAYRYSSASWRSPGPHDSYSKQNLQ